MSTSTPTEAPRFLVSSPACIPSKSHPQTRECAYEIAWSINAHMRVGSATAERAVRQHSAFLGLLRRLSANVTSVPFVHGAFDSVFVKDSAVLVHRSDGAHALLARPKHSVRRIEQSHRFRALVEQGFLVHVAHGPALEGGDVVVLPSGAGAFMGYGFRSSRFSAHGLERFLRVPVTPLQLVDPRFYHLDMALHVLEDGTTLVCRDAFTRASYALIQKLTGGECIDVTAEEALRFAINVVQVGHDVVLAASDTNLEKRLAALGYVVHVAPLDEFHLAGGSAACLVARVHEDPSALRHLSKRAA